EIGRARRYVHLLFYIFEDDEVGRRVADSLIAAAQRGVAVRLLLDAIGSRTGLARLGPGLRTAGIEVIAAMPLRFWGPNAARFDLRNHRKIVIVDGEVGYFGSQNIVSARANRGLVNEELLVRATGTIVRHLHAVLLGDRYLETGALPPESDDLAPPELNLAVDGLAQVVPSGPGYNEGSSEAVMITLMYGACSRIVLTAPYVIPNAAFLGAMTSAARRGVPVALIVDAESNKPLVQLAQQSYYDEMLRAGIRIHHHHGSFLHAKHLSIDDGVAVIGSSNFDIRSFALNAEVSVLIFDRAVVTRLRRIQESYLAKSEEITAESRRRVPRPRRAIENLARLTDTLL
ncbi:MAG: phospholipase D-like domain-containing protein, partial [Casimicrobiaceae bacterium]